MARLKRLSTIQQCLSFTADSRKLKSVATVIFTIQHQFQQLFIYKIFKYMICSPINDHYKLALKLVLDVRASKLISFAKNL